MTKQGNLFSDSARQAGARASSAREAIEGAIYLAEEEGVLVREAAILVLLALNEYQVRHGDKVVLGEIKEVHGIGGEAR